MAVYISDISMPQGDGSKLVLQIFPNGEVYDEHGFRLGIQAWAEAVQVPAHGRLGDLDALKSALWKERLPVDIEGMLEEETVWRQGRNVGLLTAQCCVNNADTIIPAEEDGV